MTAVENLTLAIPGARYNMLIEDIASGDPERKQRAQTLAKNLFQINLDVSYEVTSWFEFDPTKGQLRADVKPAKTFDLAQMQAFAAEPVVLLTPVKPSRTRLLTTAEANAQARTKLLKAANLLLGELKRQSSGDGQDTISRADGLILSDRLSPAFTIDQTIERDKHGREQLANLIQEAIQLQNDHVDVKLPESSGPLVPWAPASGPYVFVIIDKEDFERHRSHLNVSLLLHETGNVDKPFQNIRIKTFEIEEFKNNVRLTNGHEVVWAVFNVTGIPALNREMVDNIDKLNALVKEWHETYPRKSKQ